MAVAETYPHPEPQTQRRITSLALGAAAALAGIILGAAALLAGTAGWGLALLLVGLGALCGIGLTTLRLKERERASLAQSHAVLDAEYTSLQTDYSTLEQAFDELQHSYSTLQHRMDALITEREQSTTQLQRLLDDTRSHASQLSALNEVAVALNATLDRDEVLACILRQLERVVTFDSASVQLLDDDELQVIAARGMSAEVYDLRISLAENELARRVVESPAPVVLDDVRLVDFVLRSAPIRGWIGAALRVGDRTVGILTVDSFEVNAYTSDDARLVANFASQAALALHNSHLYAAAERRAAETSLLLEMTRTVGSTLHLPEVLLRAAAAIGEALHADDVSILLLDETGERLIPQAGAMGDTSYLRARWPGPTALSNEPTLAKVIKQGCARVIHAASTLIPYQTLLALPLSIKEKVLGIVLVATPDGDAPFGPHQLVLAEGLATSAALAIEQAGLYDQARRAAQMEERSRLARELHDSVTQTLFSMTLTAEAARAQIERNPVRAAAQIDRLKDAAHQSLGEMRELLLQLRPTPLQELGLVRALRDHIATLGAHSLEIVLDVQGDDTRLNPQHAAGLYRISQEAISNVLRHSGASHVVLTFDFEPHGICLSVCDNGRGFDPDTLERSGRHLGLTSMAERAAELGGTCNIDSRIGEGTTLTVRINA
jgi:signal transduction histidine kinase